MWQWGPSVCLLGTPLSTSGGAPVGGRGSGGGGAGDRAHPRRDAAAAVGAAGADGEALQDDATLPRQP